MSKPKDNHDERNRMLHARQAAAQTAKQAHQSSFPDRQPTGKQAKAVSQGGLSGQTSAQAATRKVREKGAER